MAVVERFEAWCECPSCGRLDCHLIREASDYEPQVVSSFEVATWGELKPRRIDLFDRTDERGFEVVRMCKCGREWGQA